MGKEKQYMYKVWLEVERIELNADGKEKDIDHEQGACFGIEPIPVFRSKSLTEADVMVKTYETLIGAFKRGVEAVTRANG